MKTPPPIGARDHVLGALMCMAYVVVLMLGSSDLGMSRDESFYVVAAQDYAGWFRAVAEDGSEAFTQERIDAAWDYNHEHPALIKSLFAFSWLAQQAWDLFPDDSSAFRFPGMLLSGLLLWLIYIFGARVFGRAHGAFAAACFAFMPRVFYHAHLDAFDVPITLMVTACGYAYWRSLRSRWWAVIFGVVYGLALATKHNAWVLPGIFMVHFVWMSVALRRDRRAGREIPEGISTRPWWLLSMILIGPVIFIGSWPWLWNETLPRIGWYVNFHTGHEYYNIAYLGETWFRPPFPWHYPFVMTLMTVPLVTLALCVLGISLRFRAMLPEKLAARLPKRRVEVVPDAARTDVLLAGMLLAPLLVIALPSSPIFGGTKHWMPSYPFIAMYAGLGFGRATVLLTRFLRERLPELTASLKHGAHALLGLVFLMPSLTDSAHSHPFGLSHYTFVAGGVPGAADLGMNRQFWGFTTGSLTEQFREWMPDGGSVFLCDSTWITWQMLQRDGLVPENIRAASSLPQADFVLVHHEHHFAEVDFQAWVAFGSPAPAHVLTYDGVPIITVYENPRRRR